MNRSSKHRVERIRIELTPIQTIGHYSFALLPLMFPAMELYFQLTNQPIANSFSALTHGICLGLSGLIAYIKYNELIFERLYESRTTEQFKEAVFATANKMNWTIVDLDNNSTKAVATNFWTNHFLIISINRDRNYVEIKSIFDMFLSVPDIFKTNKKHRRAFLRNYILSEQISNLNDQVIEELKAKEQQIENEPEWSLKNTLKRLIAYAFCLGFWAIAIVIWRYEGFNFGVFIFGIIGSFYILFDIYVIWTKIRKRSTHNK